MSGIHVRVWEFEVAPRDEAAFVRAYGPDGDWARLFAQDPGHVGTALLRDDRVPGRFLTIDRWRSAAAYRAFRARHAAAYEALDEQCAALTGREVDLGAWTEL